MKELFYAELTVETRHSLRESPNAAVTLRLSDYGDYGEFLSGCEELFRSEENPVFIHRFWENIPDSLITKKGLNPAFFEIRDALDRLEEDYIEPFLQWCIHLGYDILADEPLQLVTRFQDLLSPIYEVDPETAEAGEETAEELYLGSMMHHCPTEIFSDNYD